MTRLLVRRALTPKFVSPSDPAAQWTNALRGSAFFAYADNYLIDVKFGIIMDVEASRAIRQAEVGASQTMIERTEALLRDQARMACRPTPPTVGAQLDWLVNEQKVAPYIPVIDKSQRDDGISHAKTSSSTRNPKHLYHALQTRR